MTKNWIVEEIIEDACGFDSVEIDSFDTEAEAIAIEEYGEVVGEYTYYNINE